MPKVKWGGDLNEEAINSAENNGEYRGPIPPAGIYRFKFRNAQKGESSKGKPKLVNFLLLDGSWKPEHKKYDGCPLWDHMPVQDKTAFRVRAFCDALNITSSDFMKKMVADDDGNILKIGGLKVADQDLLVYVKVKPEKDEEYGERIILAKGGGYQPFKDEADEDDDEDSDSDEDDDDSDSEDAPF